MKFFHNPKCKKSRAGLEYIKTKNVDFELVDYQKIGLTELDLKEILSKLNIQPIELVRTQEELFKKELKNKNFNYDEWIKIIIENPKLMKRPIVVGDRKAAIADPVDEMDKMF
ncbi:MAG: ArsC/Spx/MgsR family protein [Bacteroidota bacterium]